MNVRLQEPSPATLAPELERHRAELLGYCYRMLGSLFEADDAVQETLVRAWRAYDRFEGRSSARSWLYRIATNVCFDHLNGRQRRARPMDLTESTTAADPLSLQAHERWVEPLPDPSSDPAGQVSQRDSVRLAFVAALQLLPPRQRAVLILCEVLDWRAAETAEFLDTTVASVNSALQRARATLAQHDLEELPPAPMVDQRQQALLDRYLDAFQRYDMEALTALIHDDATQSMPPFEQWISGRERILEFWQGPGAECRGSRLVPVSGANGRPAFAQYRPSPGGGYHAWSLQVIDLRDDRIEEFTMFLDVERLFPRWGLPLLLDAEGVGIS